MAFKKAADGITKKGKTKGKDLGIDGPKVKVETIKGSKGAKSVTNMALKTMGRNMARAKNQK